MTTVKFGNPNPQMQRTVLLEAGTENERAIQVSYAAPHLSQSVTAVEMREGFDDPAHVELTLSTENDRQLSNLAKALPDEHRPYAIGCYELDQIVEAHTGGQRPDWVTSDDPAFAAALSHYFRCPTGEPIALLTNVGRDALHAQNLTTGAQPAAFNFGALSANTGSGFAGGDTTLAGEIATGGGGLIRGGMTYAHTTGTNTSTLTKTWTANGSDVVPVVIASWAAFNASSVGTLGYEDPLNATATITISGDSLTVTFTLTAG